MTARDGLRWYVALVDADRDGTALLYEIASTTGGLPTCISYEPGVGFSVPAVPGEVHRTLKAAKALAQQAYDERLPGYFAMMSKAAQAALVIDWMERETGLPFGDSIGFLQADRIREMARGESCAAPVVDPAIVPARHPVTRGIE